MQERRNKRGLPISKKKGFDYSLFAVHFSSIQRGIL